MRGATTGVRCSAAVTDPGKVDPEIPLVEFPDPQKSAPRALHICRNPVVPGSEDQGRTVVHGTWCMARGAVHFNVKMRTIERKVSI